MPPKEVGAGLPSEGWAAMAAGAGGSTGPGLAAVAALPLPAGPPGTVGRRPLTPLPRMRHAARGADCDDAQRTGHADGEGTGAFRARRAVRHAREGAGT